MNEITGCNNLPGWSRLSLVRSGQHQNRNTRSCGVLRVANTDYEMPKRATTEKSAGQLPQRNVVLALFQFMQTCFIKTPTFSIMHTLLVNPRCTPRAPKAAKKTNPFVGFVTGNGSAYNFIGTHLFIVEGQRRGC